MKLTIARKMILIGLISVAGLVSLSMLKDIQFNKLYDIANYATNNTIPSLTNIAQTKSTFDKIDLSISQYLSANSLKEQEDIRKSLMGYEKQVNQSFDEYLKNNVSDGVELMLIKHAQANYLQYMQKVSTLLPVHHRQTSRITRMHVTNHEALEDLHTLKDAVDSQLDAVTNYNLGLVIKHQNDAFKTKEKINAISIWVTLIVAIVNIFIIVLIKRRMIKQLGGEPEQIVKDIGQVMDGYDTNIRLDADRNLSLLNKVNYLILHDRLTQLPNKLAMCHQVKHFLGYGGSQKIPFSFFKIEINGLKNMAEVIGNGIVDEMTSRIVNRLKSVLPETFILASLDTDTYGLLLPNVNDLKMNEQHANNVLRVFSSPFTIRKQRVILTINIGIVCCPEDYKDKESLFEFARLALKHSKELGENHYQFYQAEFTKQHKHRLEIEGALHHALQNNELELYYQPQVDINTEQIIGAEALIRWKHPTLGMIPPDKFIPIAEENGSIVEIGDWVMLTAFKAATFWNHDKTTPIRISINLSPRQFSEKDFIPKIVNLMRLTECSSDWIKLEVTESLLMENTDDTMKTFISITELGIPISMDDFGTGYSSLSYLTTYPLSQIKIDRSFMNDTPTRLDKCEVVKMIMRIAEIIHSDVVAEGVETSEQIEFLRSIKCNVVQGYYYYKPMPFDAFNQIVNPIEPDTLQPEAANKIQTKKNENILLSTHQA